MPSSNKGSTLSPSSSQKTSASSAEVVYIDHLTKACISTGEVRPVFKDLCLTARSGERIGIDGNNGAGKSTLLNIVAGLDKDFEGTVLTNTPRIGYVHQNPGETLAPWFSCEKNILLPREYWRLPRVRGLVLLEELKTKLAVNFSLNLLPSQLSGGQKQVVALLRALVLEPDLLLLDEPFTAMDRIRRKAAIRLIKEISQETTLFISSHRSNEISALTTRSIQL